MSNETATPLTQAEIDEINIEDTLQVYMTWRDDEGKWEVDGTTADGYPLDSRDGIYTDCGGFEEMPDVKKEEWKRAAEKHLTYIDLSKELNLARAVNDGDFQGLLLKLADSRHELARTGKQLRTAEGADAPAGAMVEAQHEAIWALTKTLDAAMNLLQEANIVSE